ncbi:unnamed protein product [Parnassius apollo]|uniref:(apollo) hypothetical protein n=1 Tax=Parnassius apollo TaxID=110799 RepID=A0A8S3WA51_PARAO|nr:unnamed protein product [Parnassius apollo]
MAWASIKGYVSSKNVQWNLKRVIELVTEKASQMGPNEWKALYDKTKKIEDFYIESDHIIDNLTDTEIIIRLGEDSSDSDSGDSGSSSSSSDENDNLLTPGTSSVFSRVNIPGCSRVTNDNLPAGVSFIDSDSD